jgi:hypothetical protein
MFRFVANRTAHRLKMPWAFAPASSNIVAAANKPPSQQQQQRRGKHTTVALQLDYYMSPQFAGIACALTEGLYESVGIDTVNVLPTCPVGLEPERVRQFRDLSDGTDVVVGSIEQNVLLPTLLKTPDLKVKAVAAMFQESPLCLASINNNGSDEETTEQGTLQVVGAHKDTVDLLKRILIYDNYQQDPRHSVVASPRASKITDLLEGRLDAIQAYTTTEVLTLERIIASATNGEHQPEDLSTIPLEGHNGAKLGYSQVLFAPEEDLVVGGDQREILKAFLQATFEGWAMAIRDSEHGARCVEEAQAMLGLSDEGNDHWDRKQLFEYNVQNTSACCDLVKATKAEGESDDNKYGTIDSQRWDESTDWLLNENLKPGFGLDSTVWEAEN